MAFNVNIIEFNNILKSDFLKSDKPKECFNIDKGVDLHKIEEIEGIQIEFELNRNYEFQKEMFEQFEFFLSYKFFPILRQDLFLYIMEYEAQRKSRLRSYKGFIKQDLNRSKNQFIEIETPYMQSMSIFSTLLKVNKDNNQNIFQNLLYSFELSFLITHSNEMRLYSEKFINKIAISSLNNKRFAYINILYILSEYCFEDNLIIRLGGNKSSSISIQLFYHKSNIICANNLKEIVKYCKKIPRHYP